MVRNRVDGIETPAGWLEFAGREKNISSSQLKLAKFLLLMCDCFFYLRLAINHLAQSGVASSSSSKHLWNFNLCEIREHTSYLTGGSNFQPKPRAITFFFLYLWILFYTIHQIVFHQNRVLKYSIEYIYLCMNCVFVRGEKKKNQIFKGIASQTKGTAAGQGLILASI